MGTTKSSRPKCAPSFLSSDNSEKSPGSWDTVKLSQQYGGQHTAAWVDSLPRSWIPYVQLARLSPPVGVCLVLFPHVFGFLHGVLLLKERGVGFSAPISDVCSDVCSELASLGLSWWNPSLTDTASTSTVSSGSPSLLALSKIAYTMALLVIGSFFLSNAIHGWNDLIDAPYDAMMERTRGRPVVRGDVSKIGALFFVLTQGLLSAAMLMAMFPNPEHAMYIAWPGILTSFYYPMAKRHTHFVQYVLGVSLAWGVVLGTAGVLEVMQEGDGLDVWQGTTGTSTVCLTVASALWTVIYDTIYGFQDREDDVKVGLKSTAVLFGEWAKPFLLVNLGLLVGLLTYVGVLRGCSALYYGIAVGGCLVSLATMIVKVDLKDSSSCWWWFRYGFWLAGGSIATGLLLECLL